MKRTGSVCLGVCVCVVKTLLKLVIIKKLSRLWKEKQQKQIFFLNSKWNSNNYYYFFFLQFAVLSTILTHLIKTIALLHKVKKKVFFLGVTKRVKQVSSWIIFCYYHVITVLQFIEIY